MKKLIYIFAIFVISVSLAACGAKSLNTANNAKADIKITYTKELSYLPSYNGIQSAEYTKASKKALAAVKYTIKNTTDTKVYEDYESILKKDGWTITKDQKYFGISAEKDSHMANVIIQKAGKDVILMIISK